MTKPIRIVHLITGLNTGGAEFALFHLLKSMDKERFDSQVVCMIPVGSVGERIRTLGIPVISLGMVAGRPSLIGLLQLVKILRKFQPAILQTWLYHADLMGLLAAIIARVKTTIWNIRSAEMDFLQYRWLSGEVVKLCASLSKLPTAVIVNSRAGQTIHARLGYRPKEWIFLPNGVDTNLFQPDLTARNRLREEWQVKEDELLIGTVGRIDPQKDHTTFVQAVALLCQEYPQLRFVCVGTGPENYRQKMNNLSTQLNLTNLSWAGQRADMPVVYNALDILVSSSIGEGFPNVVAEAMACEKPCVVTTVGDSAILVAETGICVSPGNPEALAEGILRMIRLPEAERARLGQKARERIMENFSLQKMVDAYSSLYESLATQTSKNQR